MFTWVFFPRLNRSVKEAILSAQPNRNNLQNTVPPVALRHYELQQICINSHFTKDQLLFPLYFTFLLSVPVFTETPRQDPILPFLERKCCSDHELTAPTGTGTITLPAGTGVYIPILSLHSDATYFTEPEKFDPDRFTEENQHSRPNNTYLPFGVGSRMCIGKDRYLISPHQNSMFRLLGIQIVFLCQDAFQFRKGSQIFLN